MEQPLVFATGDYVRDLLRSSFRVLACYSRRLVARVVASHTRVNPDVSLTVPDDERPPTWVFARESTTIRLRRLSGLKLHIESSENNERTFTFKDLNQLSAFHSEFERHLVSTGWSLVEFGPERRSGRDRRSVPRRTSDRRRPWLKPAPPATSE